MTLCSNTISVDGIRLLVYELLRVGDRAQQIIQPDGKLKVIYSKEIKARDALTELKKERSLVMNKPTAVAIHSNRLRSANVAVSRQVTVLFPLVAQNPVQPRRPTPKLSAHRSGLQACQSQNSCLL